VKRSRGLWLEGKILTRFGEERGKNMNQKDWERAVSFHGHECPGLSIGFKACEAAVKYLNIRFSEDENIVCITENDACGVDAIQVLLGCSFGKGNLIFRDRGKQAFTFFNRKNNESVRVVLKAFEGEMTREARQAFLLNAEVEEIFDVMAPKYHLPERARIFKSYTCESCQEGTGEHRLRLMDGKKVCLDCYQEYHRG
jgi:formylmethanofuran dehydrogenase subunit E